MKKIAVILLLGILLLAVMPAFALPPWLAGSLAAHDWAKGYFELDGWTSTTKVTTSNVMTTWKNPVENEDWAVITYHWDDGGYKGDSNYLTNLVDETWLGSLLQDYGSWEETTRCTTDDLLLVELAVDFGDEPYMARYWVWIEDGVFIAVFAAYEVPIKTELDPLANQLMPALPNCGANG